MNVFIIWLNEFGKCDTNKPNGLREQGDASGRGSNVITHMFSLKPVLFI